MWNLATMRMLKDIDREALRDSVEWGVISLLFMPPEEDWKEEVGAIASEVEDQGLKQAAQAACEEADSALYHTLLGPGGVVRPRAVSHDRGIEPGHMLAQLKELYQAVGYSSCVKEPPDHVAVMTGFVAYLKLKQAVGGPEEIRKAQGALVKFTGDYLERLANSLARDLEPSGVRYLKLAAKALIERLEAIKQNSSHG